MGRVYEACHTRLGNKRFAVKLLHEELARQPDILTRFEREAQSASTISHPNVVDVVDVHHLADGRPYLVCEYLEGEELGALLDRIGKLAPDVAVRIVRQICRALSAAHEKGIIHRDVKPENVYLVGGLKSTRVKVIDFGISKRDDGEAKLTRTGMIMGTPAYMAPEQARGEAVDHRADVYAVGGILYRALTGQRPFEGEDGAMVLTQVLTAEPERPRALNPAIPEALELLIQRAMARDPDDRFASMDQLEAELAELDSSRTPLMDGSIPSILPPASDPVHSPPANLERRPRAKTEQALRTQREVRSARPLLVLLTVLGYLWLVAGLVSAVADLLRASRGTLGRVTASEALLATLGALVATITPLALWIRHLERSVWRNSAVSVELARRSLIGLAVGLGLHGLLVLVLNLLEAVVLRQPSGQLLTPFNGPIIVAAFAAAAVSFWVSSRRPKRKP